MSLQRYNKKRNFKKTPEPPGKLKNSKSGHRFFIQKHAASHLHFDFRLEYDGVLKSWAVPKGPSTSPSVRRLAMEVEDHPLEYGNFEGTIPKGEYGGGTVMLWDKGTWIPKIDPKVGFKKGHLIFTLKGKRLKGTWNLVKSRQPDAKSKNMWFLIRTKEKNSEKKEPIETQTTSVITHRSMDEIAEGHKVWHSHSKTFDLPSHLRPQLATLVDRAPEGEEWLHEVKFDGYRIFAYVKDGQVRLFTRNGNDWTSKLQKVAEAIGELGIREALFDGEVIVPGPKGHSDFQALQNAFKENRQTPFVYYLFDLLECKSQNLRELSLEKRKEKLKNILKDHISQNSTLQYSEHIQGEGARTLKKACAMGLEGIISKRKDSNYSGGRGDGWLKVKCIKRQEFVVIGYTAPKGSRIGMGALLLAVHDEKGALRYVGKTGTGFDDTLLKDLKTRFDKIKVKSVHAYDPSGELGLQRNVTWIDPKIVAEIKFGSWTKDLHLRHSVFVGLRQDKPASEVILEKPKPIPELKKIKTTKQDKVLFSPDITKGDLFRYYIDVQKWILPHLVNRPLALLRCPDGHDKFCFFQKHLSTGRIGENEKKYIKGGKKDPYVFINSIEGLLSLVQMGVLELHEWQASIKKIEKPDQIVFDFDPDKKVQWPAVIKGALELRKRLKKIKLESFVKTTGGKGLHVVVPIIPEQGWDEVKNFSKLIAETFTAEFPDLYLANMSKAKREGKIFIDYLRNGRGSTSVVPYSTRAKAGAPVSTPLTWEELPKTESSDQFNLRNLMDRLNKLKSDPWKKFFSTKQRLPDLSSL